MSTDGRLRRIAVNRWRACNSLLPTQPLRRLGECMQAALAAAPKCGAPVVSNPFDMPCGDLGDDCGDGLVCAHDLTFDLTIVLDLISTLIWALQIM